MGQRDGFAETDLLKINIRYKCEAFLEATNTTSSGNFGDIINGFLNNIGDFFGGFGAKTDMRDSEEN